MAVRSYPFPYLRLFINNERISSCLKLFTFENKNTSHASKDSKRYVSTNRGNSNLNSKLQMYTSEQQLHIINTLHKCVMKNITRKHLNEKRLCSLKLFFEQNPNMMSLEPLLRINGLGPASLHRLCDSILEEPGESSMNKDKPEEDMVTNKVKGNSQTLRLQSAFLTPSHVTQKAVESVVSIHLGVNTISWVHLWVKNREVDACSVKDVTHTTDKKYDVHSIWDLVMKLRREVPDADIYILENNNWSNVASVKKPMKYHVKEAMITTAICSVFNQTESGLEPRLDTENRVYFLRAYTPSRLFRKIIGSERVTAQDVVTNMINGIPENWHQPLVFSGRVTEEYMELNGPMRENFSQALLLVVSFTELILLHNSAAMSLLGKSNNVKRS